MARSKEQQQMERANKETNTETSRPLTTFQSASFLSRALFLWPYPLLKIGLSRTIQEDDLPDILEPETSAANLKHMDELWKKAQLHSASKHGGQTERLSLHKIIVVDFLKDLWYIQIVQPIGLVARVTQSVALGLLIQYFSEGTDYREGYLWAFVLAFCGIVTLFEHHHNFMATWRKGLQLKTAAIAAIYAKSLRLSSIGGVDATPEGKIMNLASNDVERFTRAAMYFSYIFWGPVYAIVVLILGILMIGPAFASGYSLLLLFVPLQFYLSNRFVRLRSKIAKITDSRVNLVSQAVAGARVMKMSGWEQQFKERIENIRLLESNKIQQANRLRALNEAIYFSSSVVMSVVIFSVHVALGGVLTPRNVFTTMTLINLIQFELMKHLSLSVMALSECHVSITRLQNFLATPEPHLRVLEANHTNDTGIFACDESAENYGNKSDRPVEVMSLRNVTCYWDFLAGELKSDASVVDLEPNNSLKTEGNSTIDAVIALSDINIKIYQGELCCIIGAVGSGKSALLEAITGELPCAKGDIIVRCNSIAYCSQEPFLMDGTVRQNITFGLPFQQEWYDQIIEACCLSVDLKQFRNGDQTIVGDRGVQCSGGQRARIGLARALYQDAQVIVMDDPLSAVDTKVGRNIFYSAIQDLCIKRGKSVVLATHQHQFIGESRCILLVNGRIAHDGTYEECVLASNGGITSSLQNSSANNLPSFETKAQTTLELEKDGQREPKEEVAEKTSDNMQDHKEQKATGIVKRSTFVNYMNAMGGLLVSIMVLLLFAAPQITVLFTITKQGDWSKMPPNEQSSPKMYGLILGLGASVILLSVLRSIIGFYVAIKASRKLHDSMMDAVLRAKIEFFDTNPLGRILNRFSADVGIVDDMLPQTVFDFGVCSFMVASGIAATAVVLPYILLLFPPAVYYFIHVRGTFLMTSRELKRIEGISRSPMYAMIGESLQGIATMRANNSLEYFKKKFETVQNDYSRVAWSFIASSRWLGFRMDCTVTMLLTAASFLSVFVDQFNWLPINSSLLGLALMLIIQLSSLFQWCVRQSAEVVNYMVSVERIVEYSKLTPEAALVTAEDSKHPDWPVHGSIECDSICVRYRASLPPSLKGATFSVKSGQRIGVVGRTGAGKSTLAQALFRLLEAESGKIVIDGVDISKLGLHKLRTQMSVIPQSPILFNGCTIRENLDPFGIYDDSAVWDALRNVQMEAPIKDLTGELSSVVAEGGSNFSVGQRQLLCLARAILRKNQILVLDEPTANVDSMTDKLLQEAVARSFGFATILAIAHRLDTVIDYDQILVLGDGKVLEYGPPAELLGKEGGVFLSMVNDTGPLMAAELIRMAKSASK